MISTLAPIADELIVFPLPKYAPGDEPYTVAFAIPLSTSGLRLVCREPFDRGDRNVFDHPLSARFEEMDAMCVFDDVLVPWERVFFYGDVDLANQLWDATTARHHSGHQGVVRGLAKAELLVALAIALAESARTDAFLHVQEMLGELLGYLELVKGAILLSEEEATVAWGLSCPAIAPIQALRYQFPRMSARMVEVVMILGGGSLLSTPSACDLTTGAGTDIERFFRGPTSSGGERIRLLKLAWDATGDGFGQRQLQYERYHAGDPVRLAALQYLTHEKAGLREVIRRVLQDVPLPRAAEREREGSSRRANNATP